IQLGAGITARDELTSRVEKVRAFATSKADRDKQLKRFERKGKTTLSKTEKELRARRESALSERKKVIDRARTQVSDVRETVGSFSERATAPVAGARKAVERRFKSAA